MLTGWTLDRHQDGKKFGLALDAMLVPPEGPGRIARASSRTRSASWPPPWTARVANPRDGDAGCSASQTPGNPS